MTDTNKPVEYVEKPSSPTGGVKAFPIAGRMARERERCLGMTAEERAWRAQYLKDQILSPNEPRYVPEYWELRLNPIRRFYRYPLDCFGKFLIPYVGSAKADHIRFFVGKLGIAISLIYLGRYYALYNGNDWTRRGGWTFQSSRETSFPGWVEAERTKTTAQDFGDRGFRASALYE